MLQVNQAAPLFEAKNSSNETINLSQYQNDKIVVLYFYPKDDTTGCTIQANEFTALTDEFTKNNAVVYGISKDGLESHQNFIKKYNLSVDLLTDADGSLCEKYFTWGEKEKNGAKKMGLIRSTFIIDKSGILRYVEYGVKAPEHAAKILDFVKNLGH